MLIVCTSATGRKLSSNPEAGVQRCLPKNEDGAQPYPGSCILGPGINIIWDEFVLSQALRDPAERDMAGVEQAVAACFDSADYTEGRTAFMEKRKPRFQGRVRERGGLRDPRPSLALSSGRARRRCCPAWSSPAAAA